MTVSSIFVKDAKIEDLWELDVLRIAEHNVEKSRENMALANKEFFLHTIREDEEGRYEVKSTLVRRSSAFD